METRKLGSSGLSLSLVGLGCNNFGGRIDLEAARKVIDAALEPASPTSTPPTSMATAVARRRSSARCSARVATRSCSPPSSASRWPTPIADHRGSRAYVRSAVEASLRRLQTDCIDLLFMHEPDPSTPIDETLGALDELVKAGKIRHVAASNFSAAQIDEAVAAAKKLGVDGFVGAQDEYSLPFRDIEKTFFPALKRNGLGLVPYFPLAGGALTGKYRKGAPHPKGTRHTDALRPLTRAAHWTRSRRSTLSPRSAATRCSSSP